MILAEYELDVRESAGKPYVWDVLRKKEVRLTPEEFVRQQLIHFLMLEKRCPPALMAVERGFQNAELPRRFDLLVFDRKGAPWLIAECKRPDVPVGEAAAWQAARYNMAWAAPYVLLTNGLDTMLFHRPSAAREYGLIEDLPVFPTG